MTPPAPINWDLLAGVFLFGLACGLLIGLTVDRAIRHALRLTGANDNGKGRRQ